MVGAKYQIIPQSFEGQNIKFIKKDSLIWLTSGTIAKGLKIHRKNVNSIFNNNRELLEPFSRVINLMSRDNRPRDVRVFDRTGFIGICMRSNTKKAIPFQKWALNVIDNVLKTGQHIEEVNLNPLEYALKQNEIIKTMITNQLEQTKKLEAMETKMLTVDTEVKEFKKRYEDERLITPETKKKIKDLISECVENSGRHYNYFYSLIWAHFGISGYKDTTEKKGKAIIRYIRNTYEFNRYLLDGLGRC